MWSVVPWRDAVLRVLGEVLLLRYTPGEQRCGSERQGTAAAFSALSHPSYCSYSRSRPKQFLNI